MSRSSYEILIEEPLHAANEYTGRRYQFNPSNRNTGHAHLVTKAYLLHKQNYFPANRYQHLLLNLEHPGHLIISRLYHPSSNDADGLNTGNPTYLNSPVLINPQRELNLLNQLSRLHHDSLGSSEINTSDRSLTQWNELYSQLEAKYFYEADSQSFFINLNRAREILEKIIADRPNDGAVLLMRFTKEGNRTIEMGKAVIKYNGQILSSENSLSPRITQFHTHPPRAGR